MNKNFKNLFAAIILMLSVHIGSGQPITAITYNIKNDYQKEGENNWNSRKEGMIKLFNHYQPEIVGVQEALLNQLDYIDSSMKKLTYFGVGRDNGKKEGEYCAIFYDKNKLTLIEESTFWLSETPEKVSKDWDAALPRICTYGLFEQLESGEKFWVLNTHFDHIGAEARKNSAKLILSKINELNTDELPVVIMGDLNATPEQEPIKVFNSSLKDARSISEKFPYGPYGTFNGFTNDIIDNRIDYFFVDKIKVRSYITIDDRLNTNKHISDHYPVLVTLYFKD